MGRGSDELTAALRPYLCVRVTDLRDIDVAAIRFDFDLTFAALVLRHDGTILHRYGGRGPDDPAGYLSLSSLARLLRDALPDATAAAATTDAPAPLRAIDLPVLQQKLQKGQRIDCVHCHTVNDAEYAERRLGGRFSPDQRWVFPDPARIGLAIDRERQSLVTAVTPDSPAARAGLRPGDLLLALGEQRVVRTFSDVQWALHRADAGGTKLPIAFRRDGAEHRAELDLAAGWKQCPPEEYAWRPYKWNLSPHAAFGGPLLDQAERRALGIDGPWALRVGYIVDWGERAAGGRAVRAMGLRKGDVVVSFGGKDDFASIDHFHAWVALTQQVGKETEVVVLRDGRRVPLRYRLPE